MVQFTTPTYYEASEVEWSDDDNERDSVDLDVDSHSNQGQQQTEGEDAAVLAANDSGSGNELTKEVSPASGGRNMTTDPSMQDTHTVGETERPSEDSFEGPGMFLSALECSRGCVSGHYANRTQMALRAGLATGQCETLIRSSKTTAPSRRRCR